MRTPETKKSRSLYQEFKNYYMTNVLLPYILVAILSLSSFFVSSRLIQNRLVANMTDYINLELKTIAGLEAQTIEQQLSEVGNLTEMYGLQTQMALQSGIAAMDEADAARMRYSDDGTYYSAADRPDGGAAVFYSGLHPVGKAEREKVAKVLSVQYLMKHIHQSCPMAISMYLNTCDSLNVIYPYFDVMEQFTPGIDITRFNFYYEADAAHNPSRGVRWTGVYLDPAGHGWMTSAIYPVYSGDFLEGVVGIDVTVSAITQQMLDIDIPWGGYGILVGEDGSILALPESGEVDWGLHELTEHDYQGAVLSDTLKPEDFNIYKMPEHADFASALSGGEQGFSSVVLNGSAYAATWNTIRLTGWKLVFLIPESKIDVQVDRLVAQQMRIGITTAVMLVSFLLLLLLYLSIRSRRESRFYSSQLMRAKVMIESIGRGEYIQQIPRFEIEELEQTACAINEMSKKLEAAQRDIVATHDELLAAKNAAEKASSAKSEFLSNMSHAKFLDA